MHWLRFSRHDRNEFGIMEADWVGACRGDMFSAWEKTDELGALNEIRWETPCTPTKMIAPSPRGINKALARYDRIDQKRRVKSA